VTGAPLSPTSFATVKKAKYRVILRGRIDHPIKLSIRGESGQSISGRLTVPPGSERPDAPRWKILKPRLSTTNAALFVDGDFDGQVELRALDSRAPLRSPVD